jgi:hypothetical protein
MSSQGAISAGRIMAIQGFAVAIGVMAIAISTLSGALAADRPRTVVVPIDVDQSALRHDDPVVRRVIPRIGAAFSARGHDVTLGEWFQHRRRIPHGTRMSVRDWIGAARDTHKRPNLLVAVKVHESIDHRGRGTTRRLTIRARIYDFPAGRVIHESERTARSESVVPADCDRECVAAALASNIELTADKLGQALAAAAPDHFGRAPSPLGRKREYTLVFDGFERGELKKIRAYLVKFTGYIDHTLVETSRCLHRIAYLSRIKPEKMRKNMRQLYRELLIPQVTLGFGLNRVTSQKRRCKRG